MRPVLQVGIVWFLFSVITVGAQAQDIEFGILPDAEELFKELLRPAEELEVDRELEGEPWQGLKDDMGLEESWENLKKETHYRQGRRYHYPPRRPHYPRPRPPYPYPYPPIVRQPPPVTCYAGNAYGVRYWATGYHAPTTQHAALQNCMYSSGGYGCYALGCQVSTPIY